MIPKSIRGRVQLWHTLLLILIIGSLLTFFYRHQRVILYQDLDRRLREPITRLLPLFSSPPRQRGPRPGGRSPRMRRERPLPEGFRAPEHRNAEQQARRQEAKNELTEKGRYLITYSHSGERLNSSELAPSRDRPSQRQKPGEILTRTYGKYREISVSTPSQLTLVIGSSIEKLESRLTTLRWKLFGIGASIIALGFFVGGFLFDRSLRPLKKISDAAHDIAEGDLSTRIQLSNSESELGKLSLVLDDTFEKLEQSFRHQARFTADASHEMRTPIAVILAKSQFALSRDRPAEKYRDALQTCMESAQHMRHLIDSLLDLSRADSGQLHLDQKECQLDEILQESLEFISPLAEKRNLSLSSILSPVVIQGDPQRIRQVMINLLSNAVKYNEDRGEISLSLATESENALIQVSNTGQGISPAHLPHLFERFYRVDEARTANKEGSTGLGLAITKAIIEAHGGQISVQSELDRETCFEVRLPLDVF